MRSCFADITEGTGRNPEASYFYGCAHRDRALAQIYLADLAYQDFVGPAVLRQPQIATQLLKAMKRKMKNLAMMKWSMKTKGLLKLSRPQYHNV